MTESRMKWWIGLASVVIFLGFGKPGQAQMGGPHHGPGHSLGPDSLQIVELSGTVLVDSSHTHPMYYLDTDNDGSADYQLMFGPWWYRPESGAQRPGHGDTVTLVGGLEDDMQGLPQVIVFELNGQKWRDPVAVGSHGWWEANAWETGGATLTVTGMVLVDSTHYYPMYFLDTDGDSIPDYRLGFGPYWYEPDNGLQRPQAGESVTIFGIVHQGMFGFGMLTVYRINGQEWRPLNAPAPWAGTWIHRGHADSAYVYCANDSSNWIGFAPGHMGRGNMHMGGMRWPDSVFVMFWEVHPDSMPGDADPGYVHGYYVDVRDPQGSTMMGGSMWGGNNWGGHHGRMQFEKDHRMVLRYTDEEMANLGLDESKIHVRYWDPQSQQWQTESNAQVDPQSNTVTLTSNTLNTYYVLASESSPTGIDSRRSTPSSFELLGNYPNPFNPETTIAFRLDEPMRVTLQIYNLGGQKLITLVDDWRNPGLHRVIWNGKDAGGRTLSSGMYMIRLQAGEQVQSKPVLLVK